MSEGAALKNIPSGASDVRTALEPWEARAILSERALLETRTFHARGVPIDEEKMHTTSAMLGIMDSQTFIPNFGRTTFRSLLLVTRSS